MKLLPAMHASSGAAAMLATFLAAHAAAQDTGTLRAALPRKEWIYFTDRGSAAASVPNQGLTVVGERALKRRARVLPPAELVSSDDLPVKSSYVSALETLGVTIVVRSRWMNAVSAVVPSAVRDEVAALPFVRRIEPVRTLAGAAGSAGFAGFDRAAGKIRYTPAPAETEPRPITAASATGIESVPEWIDAGAGAAAAASPLIDYGPSFAQLDAVRVPALHAFGVTGRDVVVGFLDTGFRWRSHRSLSGRRVLGEWDFISGDGNTADGPGDPPGEDRHGTLVFSVLGGLAPGSLAGPAFDASFLLAKTEYEPTETQVEEDYWAAGMEWLEANGAEVVNTSLGYNTWDDGSGYSWANGDFDGKTTVVAKAAVRAARLGVFLSVSMGNEGNGNGVSGTLLTPADVDTALSVGAATTDGQLSTASSTGPTSDGRFKPDLIAPGVSVYCASSSGTDSYSYASGTSLASPLAAGSAALLLSARPELTPVEMRDILRASADTARALHDDVFPNNFTGWGYLDATAALLSSGPVFSNRPTLTHDSTGAVVSIGIASRPGIDPDSVVLWYRPDSLPTSSQVIMAMGRDSAIPGLPGAARYSATIPVHPAGTRIAFGMTAVDSAGRSYASPPASRYDRWVFAWGNNEAGPPSPPVPMGMRLFQNYPNPFNAGTNIVFDLPTAGRVTVRVFDVLGRQVAVPFDGSVAPGPAAARAPIVFDGTGLPTGLYLCRLSSPSGTSTVKMLLVR